MAKSCYTATVSPGKVWRVVCSPPAARAAATRRQQPTCISNFNSKTPKKFQATKSISIGLKGLGFSPCGLLALCRFRWVTCLMYAFGFPHEDVAMTLNIDENKSNFRQPGIRRIR